MVDFEKAIEIFNYRFSPGIIIANDAEITKYDEEILQTQTLVNIAMNYTDAYHWKSWKDSVPNKKGVPYVLLLNDEDEPSVIAYRKRFDETKECERLREKEPFFKKMCPTDLVFECPDTGKVYYNDQVKAWFELPRYKDHNEGELI